MLLHSDFVDEETEASVLSDLPSWSLMAVPCCPVKGMHCDFWGRWENGKKLEMG